MTSTAVKDNQTECLHETCEQDSTTETIDSQVAGKPNRVSQRAWERFQSLQKRTDTLVKRSEEKRIKHLKKQVMDTVKESLKTDEEKTILQHEIDQYHSSEKESTAESTHSKLSEKNSVIANNNTTREYEERIQPYLGINDHLGADVVTKKGPQSGLEKEIESALAVGDIKKAEQLSDRLANRDFAVKITEAANARDFLKRKKEEEELQKSKKKKKLHWGFEHKQRWETKSNM